MKLRTHINLIVACFSAVFIAMMLFLEIGRARGAISEEIRAANVVATQLLSRVAKTYERDGPLPVLLFLKHLGRVRANEITLHDSQGALLYESPAATYKAGREAPQWFAHLLLPDIGAQTFSLSDGARLAVEANPSRAVLDAWDDFLQMLVFGGVAFVLLNLLVFALVRHTLAPLPAITSGLRRIEQGELSHRLPHMPDEETQSIGSAFNRMAEAVEQKWQAEREAREAQASLAQNRELAQLVEQRLEEERRAIARELHDEFAQSVTAIRSLAVAIAGRTQQDSAVLEAAQTISREAAALYDSMHGLIPRLAPIALDTLGLAETLQGLIAEWQRRHPGMAMTLHYDLDAQLGPSATLAIYRTVQESLINAIRHANASAIEVEVTTQADSVQVRINDNGRGLPPDWTRPGRFGLRGLRERVMMLGGQLEVHNGVDGGVEVFAKIPLTPTSTNNHGNAGASA
jgi:two-component system sensor histidine kinase UhpB